MSNQHQEWEVEKILQRGCINSITHYLVKWVGYPLQQATWEPLTNLDNCQHAILQFETSLRSLQLNPKKSRKKKEIMQIFRRGRNQIVQNKNTGLKIDDGQVVKDKKDVEKSPKSSRMIELIPVGKPKMTLDDEEVELHIIKQAGKIIPTFGEQILLRPELPINKKQKGSAKDIQTGINDQRHEFPQVLELLECQSYQQFHGNKNLQKQLQHPEASQIVAPADQTLTDINASQWQPKEAKQQGQSIDHSSKKKKQKKKLADQRRKKHPFKKTKDNVSYLPKDTEIQGPIVENQQKIGSNKELLQKSHEKVGFLDNCKDQQKVIEVEIKNVNDFIQLLQDERSVRCDQALKTFQRNTLLSITVQGSNNMNPIRCPILDLYESPEALQKLGSLSILKQLNTKMSVALLVRLRYGWYSVGKVEGRMSIGAVRLLDEESWDSVFASKSDC